MFELAEANEQLIDTNKKQNGICENTVQNGQLAFKDDSGTNYNLLFTDIYDALTNMKRDSVRISLMVLYSPFRV